jgi:hypothetical protein
MFTHAPIILPSRNRFNTRIILDSLTLLVLAGDADQHASSPKQVRVFGIGKHPARIDYGLKVGVLGCRFWRVVGKLLANDIAIDPVSHHLRHFLVLVLAARN